MDFQCYGGTKCWASCTLAFQTPARGVLNMLLNLSMISFGIWFKTNSALAGGSAVHPTCVSPMALSHLGVGKEGQSQKGKSESRTWGLFLAAAQVGLFINDYSKADHQQPLQKKPTYFSRNHTIKRNFQAQRWKTVNVIPASAPCMECPAWVALSQP